MANQTLYGFLNLESEFDLRVDEVGIEAVQNAIDASVAEHNRQVQALLSMFVQRTDVAQIRYETPVAGRLQPLDQDGRALPIQAAGHYDLAFPLQMAGSAWGANWVTQRKMTVANANRITATMLEADMRWIRDHILNVLLADSSYTWLDPQFGTLTIKPLANGDTDTYLIQTGSDAGAVDTHQLAQASAIDASNNPYPTIEEELLEHPENGGEVVAFISSSLKTATRNLSTFLEPADPNVISGNASDRVSGSLGVTVPGQVLGYVDGVWVVEWKSLPAGYIVAATTAGDAPVAMREDEETDLRGFQRVAQRSDHPFYESQWLRRAGFGAWNRVGAVAYYVGGGAYAVPTGYGGFMA